MDGKAHNFVTIRGDHGKDFKDPFAYLQENKMGWKTFSIIKAISNCFQTL